VKHLPETPSNTVFPTLPNVHLLIVLPACRANAFLLSAPLRTPRNQPELIKIRGWLDLASSYVVGDDVHAFHAGNQEATESGTPLTQLP
jgi:hypothetical protein